MDDVEFELSAQELAKFGEQLLRYQALFGKSTADILRQQCRLIAVNLATNTQPYGLDDNARLIGQKAVLRDVGKVYRSADKVFAEIARQGDDRAKAWYKAVKHGDAATAQRILREVGMSSIAGVPCGPFDDGKIHAANRNRRGRVSREGPLFIVSNPAKLVAYQKKIVTHVGAAKSSWAACASQLGGTRGIPLWARKNKAHGRVQDLSGRPDDPRIIMSSQVDYMGQALPEAGRRSAVEIQRRKMETSIRKALEAAERRAGLGS